MPAETGRPGYDPGDLLRLYLYGYLPRIRSSRRLEQETHRKVELMWLLRRLTPDFKTIADFRRDHSQALKGVGRAFILLCRRLDLFGGELLAIDGSKFRGGNARDRSYTAPRRAKLQAEIDATLARYLQPLDAHDQGETEVASLSAAALQDRIATLQQRRARYATLQTRLTARGATALSLTEPDSRPMVSGAGIEICYNVQTAVDAKHKLIVAETVTNAAPDRDQLSPVATATQDLLHAPPPVVVADQGYYHGAESKACLDLGITPLGLGPPPPPMPRSASIPKTPSSTDAFLYDPRQDVYRCPAGATLTERPTTVELGRTIKNYRPRAGATCARQPHGTMKRGMDQGYFLCRGLAKVRGEFSLTTLAYTRKRVLNLLRVPRLLAALA